MFPTIGNYNQTIQNKGSTAFKTLTNLSFVSSKTDPIKVFLFGSGSYAVVFKAHQNDMNFAIRCFLSAEQETIIRYKAICDYLKSVNANWKSDSQFLENEINVNGIFYPILKMEWIEGVLINQFVSSNLMNEHSLYMLQKQLVEVSDSLEQHKVGHGDLQCGNIIVQGTPSNFKIRLIDYDGMFVPSLTSMRSIENGRSEFQHPNRTPYYFNYDIDRFSFWVLLTALEALKFDTTFWKEVMQGGYNTLDNFLFTISDFRNTSQSKLFNQLQQINEPSLTFYTDKLKLFCTLDDISQIDKPILYKQGSIDVQHIYIPPEHFRYLPTSNTTQPVVSVNGKVTIISNKDGASVLTSNFQKLGITPLILDQQIYEGKSLLISNGKETKRITVSKNESIIEINFSVL